LKKRFGLLLAVHGATTRIDNKNGLNLCKKEIVNRQHVGMGDVGVFNINSS
jgi:hypothetical protein